MPENNNDDAAESTAPQASTPAPDEPGERAARISVVGIGASAGGLEALTELIQGLPADLAYIVVQHLAPDHETELPRLLGRGSGFEAVIAVEGTTIEPARLYVVPPGLDAAVVHGVIHLITPPSLLGPRLSIDYLFRSLAQDLGPAAIGIVLSGTGTDGTFGLRAIKAAGGLTFVQDPSTAKYDGMPQSSLSSGAADICLAPKEIGAELTRIAKKPRVRSASRVPEPPPHVQDQLGKLFVLVRSEFGTDLSHYKPSTIDRRIERRMAVQRVARLEDYVTLVQSNRQELRALYKDMLITVTSFFRDLDVFEALTTKVFPRLLERRDGIGPIRVWVPACATGEEAYSIAIGLVEMCEEKTRDVRIQIFGTDIDEESIQFARRGIFPANITLDVSPERISRFFVKKDGDYQVSRRIRDLLVFSTQNILKDAPFSRIDLISCRNLLIYLQPASQKKILRTLHYALNPTGYLLLGASETVGDAPDLFASVDRKHKLYAKKHGGAQAGVEVAGPPDPKDPPLLSAPAKPTLSLQGLADRKVLELHGPPGVIINEDLEILQFRGHTGPYLDPTPGAASFNILRIARFELHIELRRAIRQALAQQRRVTAEVTYEPNGKQVTVKLDVVPLQDPETKNRCLLVLFHALPPRPVPVAATAAPAAGEAMPSLTQRIQELDRELSVTKEYLQTTIEEKESTLEELKSANEELQSSNEELQSTNEELETSKEEMQSTNEELTTVNEELQNRMSELSQANDDLHNVLAGVDNAVIIVGMDLRIRRYTGAAEKLFNLVPRDMGRPVGFLDPFFGPGALERTTSTVIQSLSTAEQELLASNQRWYMVRIQPYKTMDHSIRGAVITLIDIDIRKRATEMARNAGDYAARFLVAISHPLLIVDPKLRVLWTNEALHARFGLTAEETLGSLLPSIGAHRPFADPGLRQRIEDVFASNSVFRGYELALRFQETGEHAVRVGGSQIPASADAPLVLLSIEPVEPSSRTGP